VVLVKREAWVETVSAAGPVERIGLAAGISRAAQAETATRSVAAQEDTTEPAAAPAAAAAPPVSDLEAEASEAAEDAGNQDMLRRIHRCIDQELARAILNNSRNVWIAGAVTCACLCGQAICEAQQSVNPKAPASAAATGPGAKSFATPQQAGDALIAAADKYDVAALIQLFGPGGDDIIFSGEFAQDRKHAADFVAEAREKKSISVDPKSGNRAFLLVGNEDWPFPVPIVKSGDKWFFDARAGRQELLYRRIGANELDAIAICHGYVEAQYDYAFQSRQEYDVNQYAQRIISTPGKQDGLAWQNPDGTWGGPIGEKIARAIEQGYTIDADPYHGYFFKILKGQGPAAPLGEMDYVVKDIMIGGFALVAVPAEYAVTGVRSFIVSQDGVVYEKDLGPRSLDALQSMERFNPDNSWAPVTESSDTSSN
jgi:hypothetical protein